MKRSVFISVVICGAFHALLSATQNQAAYRLMHSRVSTCGDGYICRRDVEDLRSSAKTAFMTRVRDDE